MKNLRKSVELAIGSATTLLIATSLALTTSNQEHELAQAKTESQALLIQGTDPGLTIQLAREDYATPNNIIWPVGTRSIISSGWGWRKSCDSCSEFHQGIDFTPGKGEPVYSATDGTVIKAEYWGEYGYYIEIYSDSHQVGTIYAHLEKGSLTVSEGDQVKPGQHIGSVGRTGLATGYHLHFELRINGKKVNPLPWLDANAQELDKT